MKKTYNHITDDLTEVIVEHNGEKFTFLNGVIQMQTGGKFIPAKSPIDNDLLLIIEDYVFWHKNRAEIEAWIETFNGAITQKGMVVHFNTEEDRTIFLLRWG